MSKETNIGENEELENENSSSNVIPGYQDFDSYTKNAYQALINATIASNGLPKKSNYVYCQTYSPFQNFIKKQEKKLTEMINKIYKHNNCNTNIFKMNFNGQMETLINFNEKLFNRVERNLNKLNSLRDHPDTAVIEAEKMYDFDTKLQSESTVNPTSSTVARALLAKNIIRPQLSFKGKIDNSVDTPWEPKIKDKPNSIKPLAIFLEEEDGVLSFSHPYELELEQFKPHEKFLTNTKPVFPKPLDDVPLKLISTVDDLKLLYEDLLKYDEIAIDLEHHSYRTFLGVTCLMQISTADTDYIVDTLSLRNELHILNEIFTKPSVVKVLHGAILDIQWLQRDLSLYIVNMFDTHIAAKQLNYPQLSLAALLLKFCKRKVDKTYQLADWRIRPLPDELINYAREDTHYLLYIYHMLRNELLKQSSGSIDSLVTVINKSTDLCKTRYNKPLYTEDTYLNLYHASRKVFNNQQLSALRELYHWREMTARNEDESLGYVLPTHMMLQIAETLPREQQGILACCNPVPLFVRQDLFKLNRIIMAARAEPLEKSILREEPVTRQTKQYGSLNMDSPLNCPHDLSKNDDFCEGLPTLLTNETKNQFSNIDVKTAVKIKPTISVFNELSIPNDKLKDTVDKINIERNSFLCPYDRYKLMKEYAVDQSKKSLNEKKQNTTIESKEDDNTERIAKLYEKVNQQLAEQIQKLDNQEDLTNNGNTSEETSADKITPARPFDYSEQNVLSLNQMKRKRQTDYQDDSVVHKKIKVNDNIVSTPKNAHNNSTSLPNPNMKSKRERRKRKREKQLLESNQNNTENSADRITDTKSHVETLKMDDCDNFVCKKLKTTENADDRTENDKLNSANDITNKESKKKKRKRRKEKHSMYNNQNQLENPDKQTTNVLNSKPNTFNYEQVDFKRFQGGSTNTSKPKTFESKFKVKGKNKMFKGKNNNKSQTFRNAFGALGHSKKK